MIPMQLNSDVLDRVIYLVGSAELIAELPNVPAKIPFDDIISTVFKQDTYIFGSIIA